MDHDKYRVLITGSREWTDEEAIDQMFDLIRREHPDERQWTVIHGHCPVGADALVDKWCADHGIEPERHPANWGKHGRKAGMERNSFMVSLGADICLVFMMPCTKRNCRRREAHGTHGTTDCWSKAVKAEIPVWVTRRGWDA